MFDLYGISNLIGTVTNSLVALFVFTKGRNSRQSRLWSIFTLCVVIYSFGAYMAAGARDADKAFVWWQFSYVGVIMLIPLFMHFVYMFLGFKRSVALILVYTFSLTILLSNVLSKSLFIGNVSLLFTDSKWFAPAWWVYPPGPLHILYFVVLYVFLLAFLLFKLFKAYRGARGIKRTQYGYFFIATTVGFIGGGTSFLPCFGINVYPFLNVTVSFYPFLIAYAIIRHNLMDIDVILKKTIVFAGLFLFSYAVFAVFAYFGAVFFESVVKNRWIAMAPSIFVIVLLLRPLEAFLREITDKYLFQKKYDYKHLLRKFSDEVLTVLDMLSLVTMTVETLAEIIKLEKAAIYLRRESDGAYVASAASGAAGKYQFPEYIVSRADESGGYLMWTGDGEDDVFEAMVEAEASLVVTLSHRKKTVGVLVLGKKLSDELFTQDDVDVVRTLAKTLSIAIINAKLFEQLSASQAQAAQREKMAVIGTLSAGINHEICNPLGIIRGQCEVFLLNMRDGLYRDKDPKELIEKARVIMEKVVRETDRAAAITKKLASFAKPASGKMTPKVKVDEDIEEVISLVEHDLHLENIQIVKDFEEGLPMITADKKQVQEIFFNIIRNASQAIKKNGRIDIKIFRSKNGVSVKVKDSGSGITKEDVSRIFNPFFTTKDPGEGSGLGLFIVKQIVERNNGRISVESVPGEGSEFTVEFVSSTEEQKVGI